jgi:hypothetical protein
MKKYYIIDDIWSIVKSFLFHNIKKQGKHLKTKNSNVFLYNEVVKSVPTIIKPVTGPRIVYTSQKDKVAKFLYYNVQLRLSRSRPLFNTIIEYVMYDAFTPKRLSICPDYETKTNLRVFYYKNIENVKSKLT